MLIKNVKNNKAFTLIEFIIVMAIIGILVLLASPKFLDYVERAKETQIKNDTKVVENVLKTKMAENIANGDNKVLFGTDGKISNDVMKDINTKLDKDKFFYKEDDDIVIYKEEGNINKNEEEDKMNIKSGNEWVYEQEYVMQEGENGGWVEIDNSGWRYKGKDKIVQIPDTIDGKEITSCISMFADTNVEKVIGNNKNIKNVDSMFKNLKSDTLDLTDFNFNNVTKYNNFLSQTNLKTFKVNYDQIKPVYAIGMFWDADITNIDISKIDFSNTTHANYIFNETRGSLLDLSKSNFEKVKYASGMFRANTINKINFPKIKMRNIEKFDHMFEDVQNIDHLDFRFIDMNKEVIYDFKNPENSGNSSVFYNSSIESIDIDAEDGELNSLYSRSTFLENSKIKKIYIYNSSQFDNIRLNQNNKGLSGVELIKK